MLSMESCSTQKCGMWYGKITLRCIIKSRRLIYWWHLCSKYQDSFGRVVTMHDRSRDGFGVHVMTARGRAFVHFKCNFNVCILGTKTSVGTQVIEKQLFTCQLTVINALIHNLQNK